MFGTLFFSVALLWVQMCTNVITSFKTSWYFFGKNKVKCEIRQQKVVTPSTISRFDKNRVQLLLNDKQKLFT
jgi:hypothetical protein